MRRVSLCCTPDDAPLPSKYAKMLLVPLVLSRQQQAVLRAQTSSPPSVTLSAAPIVPGEGWSSFLPAQLEIQLARPLRQVALLRLQHPAPELTPNVHSGPRKFRVVAIVVPVAENACSSQRAGLSSSRELFPPSTVCSSHGAAPEEADVSGNNRNRKQQDLVPHETDPSPAETDVVLRRRVGEDPARNQNLSSSAERRKEVYSEEFLFDAKLGAQVFEVESLVGGAEKEIRALRFEFLDNHGAELEGKPFVTLYRVQVYGEE